jgi:hypothetical protein
MQAPFVPMNLPPHQHFAVWLQNNGKEKSARPCGLIKRIVERTIGMEPGQAVADGRAANKIRVKIAPDDQLPIGLACHRINAPNRG